MSRDKAREQEKKLPIVDIPWEHIKSTTDETLRARLAAKVVLLKSLANRDANMIAAATRRASERVSDRRLWLLEEPPQITGAELLIDVLITTLLGSLASKFLQTLAVRSMQRIKLRALTAPNVIPKWNDSALMKAVLDNTRNPDPDTTKRVLAQFNNIKDLKINASAMWEKNSAWFDLHHSHIWLLDAPINTAKRHAREEAKAAVRSGGLPRGRGMPERAVSAHLRIGDLAELYAYQQVFANDYHYGMLQIAIMTPGVLSRELLVALDDMFNESLICNETKRNENETKRNENETKKTKVDAAWTNDGVSEDVVFEQYIQLYEEAMWVLLFKQRLGSISRIFEEAKTLQPTTDTGHSLGVPPIDVGSRKRIKYVPKRLVDYWVTSFPHPYSEHGESYLQFFRNNAESALGALQSRFEEVEKELVKPMQMRSLAVIGDLPETERATPTEAARTSR